MALAGCAGHAQIDASANTSTAGTVPSAGTTVTSGSAGVSVRSSALAGIVIAAGVAAAAIEYSREELRWPSFGGSFAPFPGQGPAPELAPGRLVNDQDCTIPIEDRSANLRCR